MRVLGLSGSLRADSHNTRLLRAAATELPPGDELVVYDGLRDLPLYDQDLEADPPAAVRRLRQAIADADAVLVATPEYNGTMSGVIKNAIDWASRPRQDCTLAGKPVAVVGASTGLFGAAWAQADARKSLGIAGATVLEGDLPVGMADQAFDDDGGLRDPQLRARLHDLVAELVSAREPARLAA